MHEVNPGLAFQDSFVMNAVLTVFGLLIVAFIVLAVPTIVAPHSADYGMTFGLIVRRRSCFCGVLGSFAGWIFYKQRENGPFLLRIFVAALLIQCCWEQLSLCSTAASFRRRRDPLRLLRFAQMSAWHGDRYFNALMGLYISGGLAGAWGMVYMVAAIYELLGRNVLAVQFVVAVMGSGDGAGNLPRRCSCFQNLRVAHTLRIRSSFLPSLVLWSSQGLKDGPIVFFLAVSILATLKLGEKFSVKYISQF